VLAAPQARYVGNHVPHEKHEIALALWKSSRHTDCEGDVAISRAGGVRCGWGEMHEGLPSPAIPLVNELIMNVFLLLILHCPNMTMLAFVNEVDKG